MRRWTIPDLEWLAPAVDPGAILSIDSLAVRYGRRMAVQDITLHVGGGEQRLVSIGIALMVRPSLLLVDEPTRFLAPTAATRVLGTLRTLADRVYVLNSGRLRSEHTGAELLAGPRDPGGACSDRTDPRSRRIRHFPRMSSPGT